MNQMSLNLPQFILCRILCLAEVKVKIVRDCFPYLKPEKLACFKATDVRSSYVHVLYSFQTPFHFRHLFISLA